MLSFVAFHNYFLVFVIPTNIRLFTVVLLCQKSRYCSKMSLLNYSSRDRAAAEGKTAESSSSDQRNYPFRFNIQIQRDPNLNSHGLTLSSQNPILVEEVTSGNVCNSTVLRK